MPVSNVVPKVVTRNGDDRGHGRGRRNPGDHRRRPIHRRRRVDADQGLTVVELRPVDRLYREALRPARRVQSHRPHDPIHS